MARSEEPPQRNPALQERNLTHLALIIIFGIFATTLPQPQVLGRLPLSILLKSEGVSRTQLASFFFLCGLAWYFKPFAGILTDAFPLFRTRRRHYLLISSILACLSWVAIAIVPRNYSALLWTAIIINVFMVMASTVVGATLVEAGQALKATGRLTSLRSGVGNLCTLIAGPFAGWLAASVVAGGLLKTGAINAALIFTIFPVAFIFLRERRVEYANTSVLLNNARDQLATIFTSKFMWVALFFIGLFYFSPGFSTPLLYRQTDVLHLTPQFIGNLGVFSGLTGITAALLYGVLIRVFNIRTMISIGVATAAGGTLFYLFYTNGARAIMIESQNGFFFTLAEVALLDLAARCTPKGCEGLGYSLILSVRNVALFGADIVGSYFADHGVRFSYLVYINAGTTALVLIFVPFLPATLMRRKDGGGALDQDDEAEGVPGAPYLQPTPAYSEADAD